MSKEGVIAIGYQDIIRPIDFKKRLLLFDKIIVVKETLGIARQLVDLVSKARNLDVTNYTFNNQTIDFLGEEGLLEFAEIGKPIITDFKDFQNRTDEELQIIINEVKKINAEAERLHEKLKLIIERNNFSEIILNLATTFPTYFPRLICLNHNFKGLEAYPLFTNEPLYESVGRKENVLKFILNLLPEPDESVSPACVRVRKNKSPDACLHASENRSYHNIISEGTGHNFSWFSFRS